MQRTGEFHTKGRKDRVRMKIIYAFGTKFPGQKAHTIQIMQTCYALARLNCQVWLIVGKGKSNDKDILTFYGLEAHENFHICQLPILMPEKDDLIRFSWRGVFHFFCLLKILWLSYRVKPDFIILREIRLGQYLVKYKHIHKLPIIYEAHEILYLKQLDSDEAPDLSLKHSANGTRKMEEFVYNNAAGIIVITRNLKQLLQAEMGIKTPIEVIPDGTNLNDSLNAIREKQLIDNTNHKLIMYLGHLYHWKGVDVLIKAMKYIKGALLIIVGGVPGSKDLLRLKNLAEQERTSPKVIFNEFVPPHQAKGILAQADILALPASPDIRSKIFTSPLKLFEYMAASKPIVACAVPSVMEILEDGKNSVLVTPEDPKAIAQGIERVIEDPALARRIARQAYLDVQKYSWEKRAEKILHMARKCIK
jgi:glycosyltransferase involved in cell wall biosynthesis